LSKAHKEYKDYFDAFRNIYYKGTVSLVEIGQFLLIFAKYDGELSDMPKESTIIGTVKYIFNLKSDSINDQDNITKLIHLFGFDTLEFCLVPPRKLLFLLAGLSWLLTAKASKINGVDGKLSSSHSPNNKELSPHIIQSLGCIRLLGLDQEQPCGTMMEWLANVKKHVGEVLTGQGKSWQISLLGMLYALFDYQVTIACYSA
jgi:hypothetical protein